MPWLQLFDSGTALAEGPVLLLEGVRKRYPQGSQWIEALAGVDLKVPRGTIQGVIGFSGAGKSTLLRCVGGIEKVDEGRVVVAGTDLAHLAGETLRQAQRQIGVVFQHLNLLRSRTVSGNVALGLELAGKSKAETRERVSELLAWFGLQEKADQYPSQLSGGQRQRVAIARALAMQPAVLLSDEPTSALDNETTASVLNLLRSVRDEFHVTILLITHDLEAVRAICDRVAVLEAGHIVEEGTLEQLFLDPQSSAARRLIQQISGLDHEKLATRAASSVLVRIRVIGEAAAAPLLSQLTTQFGVEVNILRAQVDRLNRTSYGFLLVQLAGEANAIEKSIGNLLARGVDVVRMEETT